MCPLIVVCVLLSTCALMKWFVTKINVRSALLQSGIADRDVYVKPPRESKSKSFSLAFIGLCVQFSEFQWQMANEL